MRRLAPLLLALAACACSNTPVRIESRALGPQMARSPDHFIVAAVDNEPSSIIARAGSTPRGYDGVASYGPTAAARQTLHALEADYGLTEVSAWPIEPLHMHCAVLEVPAGTDRAAVLAALARDPRIKLAEPLQAFATRTEGYNDPYVSLQRGFRMMNVADAHPWSRGDGVKIAVIDTGADTEHPDLRGNVALAANFVDADEKQFQRDRHGTEVAGVIAAVANNRTGIVGVAPGARLLLFKACWQAEANADAAHCNSFTLARALVAAFDAHVQVVNLSLAGPPDPLLNGLIREGVRRGVLFVGAASGADAGFLNLPGVIEVASAGGAQRDPALPAPLYAPGREILTLLPGGHYDFASGDSIATAQVSGVVALLLAKDAALTAAAAYRLLAETSALASDDSNTRLVDACAAVVSLVKRGSCAQGPMAAGSPPRARADSAAARPR
ncbi:MAG TPA: S8 family serine peptidase [Steroidobacteraceae bacterium]|jgi:hypothetical protein|nr:S8 family serine peptidase [Steroidobacteraceae bacterium]